MNEINKQNTAAVILAAGKGKRMELQSSNKVTAPLAKRPLILHIVDFMKALTVKKIVVVVGHEKDSVIQSLKDEDIIFVEQQEQLGTGHAVACAIKELPENITDVLVAYGDDAILYRKKNLPIVEKLFDLHKKEENVITFLTIEQKKPMGLGRIVRDNVGKVLAIVEEKDATEDQKKITEINPGSFIFSVNFLKEYLSQVEKSPVTGEYYLTSLVDLAINHGQPVNTVRGGNISWRGVNTKEDLAVAEDLYKKLE